MIVEHLTTREDLLSEIKGTTNKTIQANLFNQIMKLPLGAVIKVKKEVSHNNNINILSITTELISGGDNDTGMEE